MPGQVIRLDATGAIVERDGRRWHAGTMVVPDIGVGEWVVVTAGLIVERLTSEEAGQIRDALLAARGGDGHAVEGGTDAAS